MASGLYAKGIEHLTDGSVDWDTDTFYAQLTKNTYTPDLDADDFRDDVTSHAAAGTSDQEVTNCTHGFDTGSDLVYLDCDGTVTFPTVSGSQTLSGVAVYKYRGGAASADELVAWVEFSAPIAGNGSSIQVTFNANGIASFDYTPA